jgi:pyruvate-ferredoxin/flavodoxin oxidoreductase
MGSGAETVEETVHHLNGNGEKVGLLKVRLFRPFSVRHFADSLPPTVTTIAVLDRTKEPGAAGEPLYQDVVTALAEAAGGNAPPRVIGGRYGLSSKEFTPAMARAVFDNWTRRLRATTSRSGLRTTSPMLSLEFDPGFDIETDDVVRCVIWGLGADGTVGANKNSVKIIGEGTDLRPGVLRLRLQARPGRSQSRTCALGSCQYVPAIS